MSSQIDSDFPVPGEATTDYLRKLVGYVSVGGNPDEEFFYLGGPMTSIPQFNFPRFTEVANKLRAQGYNIVSPVELDDPDTAAAAWDSPDGDPGRGEVNGRPHSALVGRDLIVVSLPTCVGMICIEGWEHSLGAAGESWVASYLGKELFAYSEGSEGTPVLRAINRDEELLHLNPQAVQTSGTLPTAKPGEATSAAREVVA